MPLGLTVRDSTVPGYIPMKRGTGTKAISSHLGLHVS